MDGDDIILGGLFGAFLALFGSWIFKFRKHQEEEPESMEELRQEARNLKDTVARQAEPVPTN